MALFQTLPRTPGGKPCHQRSRTFRDRCLEGGWELEREKERERRGFYMLSHFKRIFSHSTKESATSLSLSLFNFSFLTSSLAFCSSFLRAAATICWCMRWCRCSSAGVLAGRVLSTGRGSRGGEEQSLVYHGERLTWVCHGE